MRTLLSLVGTAALLSVAATGTALAGKPASGDCPFAGKWATGSSKNILIEFTIGGDGALSGKCTLNTAGFNNWVRKTRAGGDGGPIAVRYVSTYAGTVSNDGLMDATVTSATGTTDFDGWVYINLDGDLVVEPDNGSSGFVLQRL